MIGRWRIDPSIDAGGLVLFLVVYDGNMLVFIDDSGDPGFKIEKGSSAVFVIVCVIFKDELEAERTAVAIKELRRALHFPDDVEFKFNKSSRRVREKFLQTVKVFGYVIRCIVLRKSLIRSEKLRSDRTSFYNYAIKSLLQYSGGSILEAKVRIDGSGDRLFRRNFITYLRKQLNSKKRKVIKDCKLLDSRDNVLIQMADMIAGSIRRSYDDTKTDKNIYKNLILKHIKDEWRFR